MTLSLSLLVNSYLILMIIMEIFIAWINALKNNAKVLTDTYMAEAAISPMAKRTLNSEIQCILAMAPASLDSLPGFHGISYASSSSIPHNQQRERLEIIKHP